MHAIHLKSFGGVFSFFFFSLRTDEKFRAVMEV